MISEVSFVIKPNVQGKLRIKTLIIYMYLHGLWNYINYVSRHVL